MRVLASSPEHLCMRLVPIVLLLGVLFDCPPAGVSRFAGPIILEISSLWGL